MNAPQHSGGSGPPTTPPAYRQSIAEWQQRALAQRGQYEDRVRDQINRAFTEYVPPWYSSVIGYGRERNLLVATSRISGFASTLGRDLEDNETKAIAEHTLDNIHNTAVIKWATLGLAAYMTYRGRRTWRFPGYTPKLGGRFNPNEATSVFSGKKIRGGYPRLTWHVLRFTAYAAATMFLVEPALRSVNYVRTETAMANDPRLEQFMEEASSRVEKVIAAGSTNIEMRRRKQPEPSSSDSFERDDAQGNGSNERVDDDDGSRAPGPVRFTTSWDHVRGKIPTPSQTPQSSRDDWNVQDDDDEDDASPIAAPIAAPARNQPASHPVGSWERLRQQSVQGTQQQSDFNARGGWTGVGRAQSQSESPAQWGGASSSSSSEWGSAKASSDSYNGGDEDRAGAREQAQREFDEMLEKERNGGEQQSRWR